MPHKNFKALEQSTIDTMCARYRTGVSVTDLMFEFALGRNKIIKTLKEHLGSEYKACARLAASSAGKKAALKTRGRKNPHTDEWNAKIAAAHVGKTHSEETRALISQRMKERELDPEWRVRKPNVIAKIIATKRESGYFVEHSKRHSAWMKENAPMRGKKMSAETRAVMSARKKELVAQGWRPTPYERTEEWKFNTSERLKQMWRDGAFTYGDDGIKRSKLEKRVYEAILEIHPDARHTFPIHTSERSYFYDIFIPSLNTLIEVNGDFWHCNPTLMSESEWLQMRPNLVEIREHDAHKAKVAHAHGFRVLVWWESDLAKVDVTQMLSALTQ